MHQELLSEGLHQELSPIALSSCVLEGRDWDTQLNRANTWTWAFPAHGHQEPAEGQEAQPWSLCWMEKSLSEPGPKKRKSTGKEGPVHSRVRFSTQKTAWKPLLIHGQQT